MFYELLRWKPSGREQKAVSKRSCCRAQFRYYCGKVLLINSTLNVPNGKYIEVPIKIFAIEQRRLYYYDRN